jgi:parallel beta helix pectate lyase-like protein
MNTTIALPGILGMLMVGMSVADAAPRTFVSGTGSDAGTCTRAAPCLTFSYAHSQTDAGGEINCVDAGNFDSVSITKSITIDCGGTVGGINPVAGGGGIAVTGASIVVRLRNLTINGMGGGTVGIRFNNGAALFVEDCLIANFNGGPVGDGIGLKFAPPTGVTAELHVKNSVISGNGRPADGGGIVIQPAGTGQARVFIERTKVENNTYGIFANGIGSTGMAAVQIRDSVAAESKFDGIAAYTAPGAATTSITLERSASLLNGGNGILAQGSPAFVLLEESTVMSNVSGLSAVSSGNILSYQDNQLSGNVTDGAPTGVLALK